MCDSVTMMVIKVDCPQCKGKDSKCTRCGGHGVIGISKKVDMLEKPDRAPGKNPMDAVDPKLHKVPQ